MAPVSKRLSAASLAVGALGFVVAFQACESPEAFHVSAAPPMDGGGEAPGLAGAAGPGGVMVASGGISGIGSGGRGSGGAIAVGGRGGSGSGSGGMAEGGRGVASGTG